MDAVDGLPDFAAPLASDVATAFAAFGGGALAVAPHNGTLSGLMLTMTRRADDLSTAGNYASLDVSITCDYPLDEALDPARATDQTATVRALPIDLGFARLVPAGGGVALPPEMTTPIALGWSSADGARWTQRLGLDVGEVIKGALKAGTLLFGARIEFVVTGVAPRAAASVSFVPATLITELLGGKAAGFASREDFVTRLGDAGLSPGLATTALRPDVAGAVADRLLAAFGTFAPAAGAGDLPGFSISGSLPTERLDWDLSGAQAVQRAFALRLDTLNGLADLDPTKTIQELTVPPLDLGFRDVVLAANLPTPRLGVPAIGVRLSAPPAPPNRPSGINQTVTFAPPADSARVTMRFDPDETFAFDVTPFALVTAGGSAHQVDGAAKPCHDYWLELQAGDFPVTFSHISASDRLLSQAKLTGVLSYNFAAKAAALPFALNSAAPDMSVGMPAAATDAAITITAATADGTRFPMPPFRPGRIRLDLASFPGYGPHRVIMQGDFTGNEAPLSLEVTPESGTGATTVVLAPSAPESAFGYVAASPFMAGYRFRPAGGNWSPVQTPGGPLRVNAMGDVQETGMFIPSPFEIDGVQLVAEAGPPLTLRYVPASPIPELGPAGSPTLSLMKTAQMTILQLGAQFDLPRGADTALIAKVAAINPALAGARLQPAAIQITSASVMLADDNGVVGQVGVNSQISAFPPHTAVFNVTLNPSQAAQAISAIGGRRGVLFVEYTLELPSGASVTRTTDIAGWFSSGEGQNHIKIFG